MRAHLHEVDVQTLVAMTVSTAQAAAAKVLKVYPPSVFVRRIGSEFMPSAGRSLADYRDVLSDLCGKIAYAMSVPWLILDDGTSFGESREFTDKQKAKSRQQGSDCHSTLLATEPNHNRLLIARTTSSSWLFTHCAAPSWVRNRPIASFIGGGRSPHQFNNATHRSSTVRGISSIAISRYVLAIAALACSPVPMRL
jgi:hypothetical protein